MPQGILELDSYRLAQYALQIPCFVCDGGNAHDAETCRHCKAPLALTHQAASSASEPRLIAVAGQTGTGKTAYLGMLLDMLTRRPERLRFTARGAFSLSLQQAVMATLSRLEFPAPTPAEPEHWQWVHAQIQSAKLRRPTELMLPDFAGDTLWDELEHPGKFMAIRSWLAKSAAALVFIDVAKLVTGRRDLDYATLKLLTYMTELSEGARHGWRDRPIAFVFTKADQCESVFDDPNAFAERHAATLWRHCRDHLKRFRFFATSIAGACAYRVHPREGRVRFPLRIEPRGVVEPLEWLLENLR